MPKFLFTTLVTLCLVGNLQAADKPKSPKQILGRQGQRRRAARAITTAALALLRDARAAMDGRSPFTTGKAAWTVGSTARKTTPASTTATEAMPGVYLHQPAQFVLRLEGIVFWTQHDLGQFDSV